MGVRDEVPTNTQMQEIYQAIEQKASCNEILANAQIQELRNEIAQKANCNEVPMKALRQVEFKKGVEQNSDVSVYQIGDLVHVQGHINISSPSPNSGYLPIFTLPHGLAPSSQRIVAEQAKSGVWGDTRIEVNKNGHVSLRPLVSSCVSFSWVI